MIYDNVNIENTPEQPAEPHSQNWHMLNGWTERYEGIGLSGVIALPNTTFEDWLMWYRGWIKQFTTIYNATINDIDDRLTKLEGEINKYPDNMLGSQEVTDVDVTAILVTDFEKTNFLTEKVTAITAIPDDDYAYIELAPTDLIMIGA